MPPSQKDVGTYVPNATSPKRLQGLRRLYFNPYSPECLEGSFSELRSEGVLRSSGVRFWEIRLCYGGPRMAETRTEHSRMGITSFVLSFFPGVLFLVILLISALLPDPGRGRVYPPPELTPSGALLTLVLLTILLLDVVALGLGMAGVIQWRRKRLYALLGVACSVLLLVVAYVQDELYLFFN